MVTHPQGQLESGLAIGFFGNDIQRTANRIAAKQGTLRPAQHLNAFQIDNIKGQAGGSRQIDAVHIHPHGGVDGQRSLTRRHPANGHGVIVLAAALLLHTQVRGKIRHILGFAGPHLFKITAGESRYRHRGILQGFFHLSGRDNDFFDSGGPLVSYLSVSGVKR